MPHFPRISFKKSNPLNLTADALVIGLPETKTLSGPAREIDKKSGKAISRLIKSGAFTGKAGQVTTLYPVSNLAAERVILVGLGEKKAITPESVRQAIGIAAPAMIAHCVTDIVSTVIGMDGGLDPMTAAQAVTEGYTLAFYEFNDYKTLNNTRNPVKKVTIADNDSKLATDIKKGVSTGSIIASATNLARSLGNTPPNILYPKALADKARTLARKNGLKCRVLNVNDMARLKMNALLGVGQGSKNPPAMIILEHGKSTAAGRNTVCLVGKGITFDSGGISLKPGAGMDEMKYDMCGAAAVLGTMEAVSRLDLPLNVIGIIAAAENMPDGRAQRPGDIVTASNGKNIEILNTDAEGRLILADALVHAQRFKPSSIVDIATLTGACITALGHDAAGVMGTSQNLIDQLREAGDDSGDRCWQLPLWDEYMEHVKSSIADVRNIGQPGAGAGSITAAAFLRHFTGEYPWAHLDIAGTAWNSKSKKYLRDATGAGVRLLTYFLMNYKKPRK
jgi:leucyl aminopeptidase